MNENIDNCAIFSPFDIEQAGLAFKKIKSGYAEAQVQ